MTVRIINGIIYLYFERYKMNNLELIKRFFATKYDDKKQIEDYIKDSNWEIQEFIFNEKIIAAANIDTETIIINSSKKHEEFSRRYILAHEYFHIMENKFMALTSSITNATDISDLESADVFAYIFLTKNGFNDDVPKNVKVILNVFFDNEKK